MRHLQSLGSLCTITAKNIAHQIGHVFINGHRGKRTRFGTLNYYVYVTPDILKRSNWNLCYPYAKSTAFPAALSQRRPNGTFQKSGDHHSTTEQVDALIEHLRQQDIRQAVLYFQGGLLSASSGAETAVTIENVFAPTNCHPIRIVWQMGLLETIRRNLNSVGQTRLFRKLLEYALKVSGDIIGLNDATGNSVMSLTEADIETELQKENPFSEFKQVTVTKGRGDLSLLNEQVLNYEFEFK